MTTRELIEKLLELDPEGTTVVDIRSDGTQGDHFEVKGEYYRARDPEDRHRIVLDCE